jgi:hypothetical protein
MRRISRHMASPPPSNPSNSTGLMAALDCSDSAGLPMGFTSRWKCGNLMLRRPAAANRQPPSVKGQNRKSILTLSRRSLIARHTSNIRRTIVDPPFYSGRFADPALLSGVLHLRSPDAPMQRSPLQRRGVETSIVAPVQGVCLCPSAVLEG